MLASRMRKVAAMGRLVARFGADHNLGKQNKPRVIPEYNPLEFEPFKYARERAQLYKGYTYEELYGVYRSIEHSNVIKKEIRKDTIVMWLVILGMGYYAFNAKKNIHAFEDAWLTGYYEPRVESEWNSGLK